MSLPAAKRVEIPQELLDLVRDDEELLRGRMGQSWAWGWHHPRRA